MFVGADSPGGASLVFGFPKVPCEAMSGAFSLLCTDLLGFSRILGSLARLSSRSHLVDCRTWCLFMLRGAIINWNDNKIYQISDYFSSHCGIEPRVGSATSTHNQGSKVESQE